MSYTYYVLRVHMKSGEIISTEPTTNDDRLREFAKSFSPVLDLKDSPILKVEILPTQFQTKDDYPIYRKMKNEE